MITRSARGALLLAALLAGACQTYETRPVVTIPEPTGPMDGTWRSTDGVFVAMFQQGRFTSRFTATNEILAQGAYSVAGDTISMEWISVATQQQRSATCTFAGEETVTCNQMGGGSFQLSRAPASPTAVPPTMTAPAPLAPAAAPAAAVTPPPAPPPPPPASG